jgi:hypothetical protein
MYICNAKIPGAEPQLRQLIAGSHERAGSFIIVTQNYYTEIEKFGRLRLRFDKVNNLCF